MGGAAMSVQLIISVIWPVAWLVTLGGAYALGHADGRWSEKSDQTLRDIERCIDRLAERR